MNLRRLVCLIFGHTNLPEVVHVGPSIVVAWRCTYCKEPS